MEFFEFMPAWQRLLIVVGSLSICWLLEKGIPLFRFDYSKFRHASVNLSFFVAIALINFVFGLFLTEGLAAPRERGIGLLLMIDLPGWLEVLVSVLVLDLVAQYFAHVCLHKVPWLWRLHMIHHSDRFLDATSGTRHHPGDYLLREVFSFFILVLMGIPVSHYFFFRACTIVFTYINHANIHVPETLDRILSLVFITPNLHKVHHHYKIPWTDQNYGNIFSFWDRMFGTYVRVQPREVVYGLDSLRDGDQDRVLYLLKMPWAKHSSE